MIFLQNLDQLEASSFYNRNLAKHTDKALRDCRAPPEEKVINLPRQFPVGRLFPKKSTNQNDILYLNPFHNHVAPACVGHFY